MIPSSSWNWPPLVLYPPSQNKNKPLWIVAALSLSPAFTSLHLVLLLSLKGLSSSLFLIKDRGMHERRISISFSLAFARLESPFAFLRDSPSCFLNILLGRLFDHCGSGTFWGGVGREGRRGTLPSDALDLVPQCCYDGKELPLMFLPWPPLPTNAAVPPDRYGICME